jgi:hypothetical protein
MLSFFALSLVSTGANAQLLVDRPTPLPAYGRGVVTNDDSSTLVQNPALEAKLADYAEIYSEHQ